MDIGQLMFWVSKNTKSIRRTGLSGENSGKSRRDSRLITFILAVTRMWAGRITLNKQEWAVQLTIRRQIVTTVIMPWKKIVLEKLIVSYPERTESSPHPHTLLLEDPFNIIL
jgi:hypothetical protein